MKLTYEQLASVTTGAVRTWEDGQGFHACRFTAEQLEKYRQRREDFYQKALSTSGTVLRFRTDSPYLRLSVLTESGSSRKFFSVDVTVDGERVGSVDNFSHLEIGENYHCMDAAFGAYSGTVSLGEGEKTVGVYLPWSVKCAIQSLELADGASLIPVKRGKKLLAYGDSITHGYDALRPVNKYITRLADALGMEEINKAIGGEVFWPRLAAMEEPFTPDLITVAYGTNDWSNVSSEEMAQNSREFYANLRRLYPDTPILAITPIWRKNWDQEVKKFGPFHLVEARIREAVKDLPNVTVIRGWEFVPQEETLFADLRLHPTDEGFRYYFEGLMTAIPDQLK